MAAAKKAGLDGKWAFTLQAPSLFSVATDLRRLKVEADVDESDVGFVREGRLRGYFELGTAYTMIAGLLNLLAVYDAWGGPVFPVETKKKEDDEDEDDERESK